MSDTDTNTNRVRGLDFIARILDPGAHTGIPIAVLGVTLAGLYFSVDVGLRHGVLGGRIGGARRTGVPYYNHVYTGTREARWSVMAAVFAVLALWHAHVTGDGIGLCVLVAHGGLSYWHWSARDRGRASTVPLASARALLTSALALCLVSLVAVQVFDPVVPQAAHALDASVSVACAAAWAVYACARLLRHTRLGLSHAVSLWAALTWPFAGVIQGIVAPWFALTGAFPPVFIAHCVAVAHRLACTHTAFALYTLSERVRTRARGESWTANRRAQVIVGSAALFSAALYHALAPADVTVITSATRAAFVPSVLIAASGVYCIVAAAVADAVCK